jgi:hypothetical protein
MCRISVPNVVALFAVVLLPNRSAAIPVDFAYVTHAHLRGVLHVLDDPSVHTEGAFGLELRVDWFGAGISSVTGRARCRSTGAGSCVGRRGRVTAWTIKPSQVSGPRYEGLSDVDLVIAFDDVPLTCDYAAVGIGPFGTALSGTLTCRDATGSQVVVAFVEVSRRP